MSSIPCLFLLLLHISNINSIFFFILLSSNNKQNKSQLLYTEKGILHHLMLLLNISRALRSLEAVKFRYNGHLIATLSVDLTSKVCVTVGAHFVMSFCGRGKTDTAHGQHQFHGPLAHAGAAKYQLKLSTYNGHLAATLSVDLTSKVCATVGAHYVMSFCGRGKTGTAHGQHQFHGPLHMLEQQNISWSCIGCSTCLWSWALWQSL